MSGAVPTLLNGVERESFIFFYRALNEDLKVPGSIVQDIASSEVGCSTL